MRTNLHNIKYRGRRGHKAPGPTCYVPRHITPEYLYLLDKAWNGFETERLEDLKEEIHKHYSLKGGWQ